MGSKGAAKGAKGSAKGSSKGRTSIPPAPPVQKSWLKSAAPERSTAKSTISPWSKVQESRGSTKGSSKGASSGKGASRYEAPVKSFSSRDRDAPIAKFSSAKGGKSGKGKSRDEGKGKGKGKDKGKGKRKGAAPKNAQFWVKKQEEENRRIMDGGALTGTCVLYNWKQGWGFIVPDSIDDVPQEAREAIEEAVRQAKEEGREVKDESRIYFRKPDVERDFRIMADSRVTFQLYLDDKGCGACDICDPTGGAGQEE